MSMEPTTRICKTCGVEKELSAAFFTRLKKKNGPDYYYPNCKECRDPIVQKADQKKYEKNKEKVKSRSRKYYKDNKVVVSARNKQYRVDNTEKLAASSKQYYDNNKEIISEKDAAYYQENKEHITARVKNYRINNKEKINKAQRERYNNDITYRLRDSISKQINRYLKKGGSSKNGESCEKYLPYTVQELEDHLEFLFSEPSNLTPDGIVWMNWENQGVYKPKEWNDKDSSTWKWQLDHIIPHSTFKYMSLEDPIFKAAWDLTNIRPLSAKKNFLDGVNRTRHPKENK
jgi:hypothetical protein